MAAHRSRTFPLIPQSASKHRGCRGVKIGFWFLLGPIGESAPISIVRRAPPTASCSLVSPHRKRTKPSLSLFRSTEERRSPESCSSFRSREQTYAGFTTVVLGSRTRATLGALPLGSLRARLWRASVSIRPTRAKGVASRNQGECRGERLSRQQSRRPHGLEDGSSRMCGGTALT
jgi:hypothetical protein